ncbi:N-alpha-acetyltransferase 25, NatB auxiliary subunit isoform X2 [Monodelphis domestica]|uniref:N-alpha-acetyltransferase 25, NatB auxiliary subunit isoform X2 n=1 Tax=Monodelphis domestica TaxID=13616 RepID=UPI000443614F|nr:N-alpha-acetyltransferase 25, NatB auxiliary subunit isoform X2 [Monodelphis domestica]
MSHRRLGSFLQGTGTSLRGPPRGSGKPPLCHPTRPQPMAWPRALSRQAIGSGRGCLSATGRVRLPAERSWGVFPPPRFPPTPFPSSPDTLAPRSLGPYSLYRIATAGGVAERRRWPFKGPVPGAGAARAHCGSALVIMATRGHVQDPNDRRLRPIYDYLDNGNNKLAIQQADKLLKKHKDLHCAKVLKAIGLQRTGKQDDAFALAREVAALEPTDDNSLQALTILYREMHRPELVTKLYEAAVKKVPNSEEYHSHLFMAYARVGEYKKMQQAGMALYKIVPKNPYYFWSVMSLIMQSISAQDENLSKTMFLPLAERMVERMVKEDKIEAEAEVELYYMILERLGKYQEALDVIRGKLGEKLTSELQSRENKCMAMYKKLSRWPECNALSRRLLLKNSDDWQFYLTYFDSIFQLIGEAWTPPAEGEHSLEGEVHYSAEEAVKFIEERILEEAKNTRHLRGPYLAKLELIRRLRHQGWKDDEYKLGDPEELMFQYFKKFGDKPCCFTDLKVFVDLLPASRCTKFINQLLGEVSLTTPTEDKLALPADIKGLQQHLCVVQLTRLLGLYHGMDKDQKLKVVRELMLRYHHGLEFGKSCLKTELQFSDYYCLLAVHVLIDIWLEAGEDRAAWQALILLEEGLTHSPSNAQFKLLLVRIYCLLGAFEPVVDLYSSLDAKHIQHDTIGYLLTRYAESLGQYAAASQACNFALRFFHSNQKDTSEYIIQAYKYGAFEKIPEFIAFRNRLNNSLHFAQVRTERMLLDLLLEANISTSLEESVKSMSLSPEEDDIPWKDLRDNRDLHVFFTWDPKEWDVSEEHKKLSLEEETLWLRIRSLTLRLVSGLPTLSHPTEPKNSDKTTENGVSSRIDIIRSLLQQLEGILDAGKRFVERKIQYPFLGPVPTRMAGFFSSGCCQCQTSSFYLISDIYELDTNGLEDTTEIQERIGNSFESLLEQLREVFSLCKGDILEVQDGHLRTHPSILENLVFFVETISIVLWVTSYCDSVLQPYKLNIQKRKKKKKETNILMPPVFSSFQRYVAGLQLLISSVLENIKGLETLLAALKLEELSLEDSVLSQSVLTDSISRLSI